MKGACAHLENQLERPLQRVVCQMHFAELPARHLFYHFYGKPNGPIGPGGEFGNMLNTLNENLLPFVEYETIPSNVPIVPRELFRDKQDLIVFYDLIRAVENGREHVDPAYLTKQLPAQSTVRWNTWASRILRHYMQCPSPSENLKILVNYILKAFGKMVFAVILYPAFENGSQHYLDYLIKSKECREREQKMNEKSQIRTHFWNLA